MGRTFSVDLDDKTMNSLEEIMVKWPKKSRNGVIRHIINTYGSDKAEDQYRLDWMGDRLRVISEQLKELQ